MAVPCVTLRDFLIDTLCVPGSQAGGTSPQMTEEELEQISVETGKVFSLWLVLTQKLMHSFIGIE